MIMEINNGNKLEYAAKEFATKLYPENNFSTFSDKVSEVFVSIATKYFSQGFTKSQNHHKKLKMIKEINFKGDFKKILADINKMIDSKHNI